MSALPLKADIVEHARYVRFVPKADSGCFKAGLFRRWLPTTILQRHSGQI